MSDTELRLAYAGALALAYPSRYEGFGLPVAEAMASGCPVITTRAASLPEVAGEAAVYVDPDDPGELARAFEAVRDPARRTELVAAGLDRAKRFDWERAAATAADLLAEAARAETPTDREERAATWRLRQNTRAQDQAEHRASRRAQAARREQRVVGILLAKPQLKALALRHLPPWAVRRLRTVKAELTRVRASR